MDGDAELICPTMEFGRSGPNPQIFSTKSATGERFYWNLALVQGWGRDGEGGIVWANGRSFAFTDKSEYQRFEKAIAAYYGEIA